MNFRYQEVNPCGRSLRIKARGKEGFDPGHFCEQAGMTGEGPGNSLARKLCSKVREAEDQREWGPKSSWT